MLPFNSASSVRSNANVPLRAARTTASLVRTSHALVGLLGLRLVIIVSSLVRNLVRSAPDLLDDATRLLRERRRNEQLRGTNRVGAFAHPFEIDGDALRLESALGDLPLHP